ncbi:MAG: TonB-dependent receptor [Pseudomonadota bacterium]
MKKITITGISIALALSSCDKTIAQSLEPDSSETIDDFEVITVTSSRRNVTIDELPRSIRVFDDEYASLLTQTTSVQEILGKLVPGIAPPVTEGSAASITLRGRAPLYLIDGVPIATNTNFSRFLDKFDPQTIERVEVSYGPTSIYGSGASGGVVQFFTKDTAPGDIEVSAGVQVRTFITDEDAFDGDGTSPKVNISARGSLTQQLSFVGFVSYEEVNGVYRAQGDLLTGRSAFADDTTVFGKLKYEFDKDKNLTFTINSTKLEPNDRFFELSTIDAGDGTLIASEAPITFSYAQPPTNEFLFYSINYVDEDFYGGLLSTQFYSSDSEFLNPGSDIRAFRQSAGGPFPSAWPGLWQTGRQVDELGIRGQYSRDMSDRLDLTVGFDYQEADATSLLPISSEDDFDQTFFYDAARSDVQHPPFTIDTLGLFVETGYYITDDLKLTAGIRWDEFDYDIIGPYDIVFFFFVPPGERPGGSGSADGTSFNLGFNYDVTESVQIFTNYSEGFTVPDLAFIPNNVLPGVSVSDSNLIEPSFTDSFEVGLRASFEQFSFLLAAYYSESEFASIVSIDGETGLANRTQSPIEITGFEFSGEYEFSDNFSLGGSITYVDGEIDPDGDGPDGFIALTTQDNPPLKITLEPSYTFGSNIGVFGQMLYVAERDDAFEDGTDANPSQSYTLFDAGINYAIDWGQSDGVLSLQASNLFNKEYVPAGEATFIPGRIYAGPGRSLTLSYQHTF